MDLTFLRSPEYQSFRKNLDYIWDDEHPQNIEVLKLLMFQRGFKTYRGDREYPTVKQTEIAWNYMKDRATREHYIEEIKPVSTTKTYKTIWISAYSYKRGRKTIHVKKYKRIMVFK